MDYDVGVIFSCSFQSGRAHGAFGGRLIGKLFFLLSSVSFSDSLCAAGNPVSCVAMNNHRYVICTMVVSCFTPSLKGKAQFDIALHKFQGPSIVRLLVLLLSQSELCCLFCV